MDVRCEKCQTEYDFDEARVTEAGVTVKCTQCGFVFKVKKRATLRPTDELPPELSNVDKTREWKIRQSTGNIYTCRELTTLQKWIVERKVSREDEISLTGEAWKRLGNIPELAGFFIVVEQAAKAAVYEQQIQTGAYVPSSPSLPVAPAAPPPAVPLSRSHPKPPPVADSQAAWNGLEEPSSPGRTTFVPPEEEAPDEDDLAALRAKSSHRGLAIAGALVGAAVLGYGAYAALSHREVSPELAKVAVPVTPPAPAPVVAPAPVAVAPVPVAVVDAGVAAVAQVTPPVPAAPTVLAVDAGVPAAAVVVAPPAKPEVVAEAVEPAPQPVVEKHVERPARGERSSDEAPAPVAPKDPPKPHGNFEALMAQGRSLEQHDKARKALDMFLQAITVKPTSAEAWVGKANCLVDLDRGSDAEEAFKQALSYAPGYSEASLGLAAIYKSEGKRDEAVRAYKSYLAQNPSGPDAEMARRNLKDLSE